MAPSTTSSFESWAFDVSALMVLVGEHEELRNRLAVRSLAECLVAAPAAGLQSYLKSYEAFLDHSQKNYFSPYGCKTAPLRNMKLDNAIRQEGLLKDGNYSTFRVLLANKEPRWRAFRFWTMVLWVGFTWLAFVGLLLACVVSNKATWVGTSSCIIFTGWSIVLRLVEYCMVHQRTANRTLVSRPDGLDAAIFLGRANSAMVLEGDREDVKNWTSGGLAYRQSAMGLPASFWQSTTRLGTLLVLLYIFTVIPNGSPMDQLVFIVLNIIGQANALFGHHINSQFCLASLQKTDDLSGVVRTRKDVYARILRQFEHIEDKSWIDKVGLLPDTPVWRQWRDDVVLYQDTDPKQLYTSIEGKLLKYPNGMEKLSAMEKSQFDVLIEKETT
ncbi:hypothetical protein IQ07DRAFT_583840 [Pyrenochaeta sp. DS3sAY3a]|nr:hypothetical protein IQ07DRAFT_583840 [Pyrenochaeta sp. DS3sAY3a]